MWTGDRPGRPEGVAFSPVPFPIALFMIAFGILNVLYVLKLRITNNPNYSRIWDIEWESGRAEIGAGWERNLWRWNPRAWEEYETLWGKPRRPSGWIDFDPILIASWVTFLWSLALFLPQLDLSGTLELSTQVRVSILALVIALLFLWTAIVFIFHQITTMKEREGAQAWKRRHPLSARGAEMADPKKVTASPRGYWLLAAVLSIDVILAIAIVLLSSADANTKALIVTAVLAVAGWLFTSEFQRRENAKTRMAEIELEHRRRVSEIQLQSYEARREIYESFLGLFQEATEAIKKGSTIDMATLAPKMMKANLNIQLLGSDEVCRHWDEF